MGGGQLYIIFLIFGNLIFYLLHFIKAYIFSNEPKILNDKLKLDRSPVVQGQVQAFILFMSHWSIQKNLVCVRVFNSPLKILNGLNILSCQDNQNIGNEYILQYIDRDAAETNIENIQQQTILLIEF
ncbi:Hypothetical_protein [Hexamita inflata]|uniref:Hypothetical_protein n=1 Tax=Hexamita inflata TaxID=28002 RepID=A0AA86TWZ0_9EUKA|nr:Hypothetical protein HINF_LOCUS17822 [Hexamita inflata]